MTEVVTLVLLWIYIGFLFFCAYKLGEIKGEEKYFQKYLQEKHHSQELYLKCIKNLSKEDYEEIKDFHLSHLKNAIEEEE